MNVQRIDPGSRIYKAAKQNLFVFPLNLPIIRRTKHWNHFFPFINFHINLWNYVYSLEIKNSRDRMRTFILDIHQWRIENLDTFFFCKNTFESTLENYNESSRAILSTLLTRIVI